MDINWKIALYIYIYTAIRGEDSSTIHLWLLKPHTKKNYKRDSCFFDVISF